MKYLHFLITLPITVFAILFSSSNTSDIVISLSPIYDDIELPIYILVLGMLGIGFFLGGLFVWMNGYKQKGIIRQERKRANFLEKELKEKTSQELAISN